MTTEEKAIAYDKALERAKKLKETCDNTTVIGWCEYIFQELVESEDERIRKAIIEFFELQDDNTTYSLIPKKDILVWLEKHKYTQKDVDDACLKGVTDAKNELEKQGDQDNNEDVDVLQRFSFYSYKDEPNVLYLSGLYVNEEYRNKGIGTKILKIANEVSAMMKCNYIRLKTESGSDAERLYKETGYKTFKKEGNQVWLEKQEDKEYVFRPLVGCDIESAAIQAVEQQKLGKKIVLAFNGAYIPVEEKTTDDIVNEYYSWLEKQGEQKSAKNIVEKWKDMRLEVYQQASGNRHEPNCSDDTTKMFSLNDIDEIIEKISEQKTTDKSELKFKVGDWIVYKENIYQIHNIGLKKYYECLRTDGTVHTFNFEYIDSKSHLWAIQDSKDGDVLVDGNFVGLFKENNYNPSDESGCAYLYCSFDIDNNKFYTEFGGYNPTYLYPATKEQRDLLFTKMKEEGYEWNPDKKEVTKIEDISKKETTELKPVTKTKEEQ